MLMITQGGTRLVSQLAEQGISAAVIGRTTDNNDRILVNDEEKRFLGMQGMIRFTGFWQYHSGKV